MIEDELKGTDVYIERKLPVDLTLIAGEMMDYTISNKNDRKRLNDYMQIKIGEQVRKIEQYKGWPTLDKNLNQSIVIQWKDIQWEPRFGQDSNDQLSNKSKDRRNIDKDIKIALLSPSNSSGNGSNKSKLNIGERKIGLKSLTPRRRRFNNTSFAQNDLRDRRRSSGSSLIS